MQLALGKRMAIGYFKAFRPRQMQPNQLGPLYQGEPGALDCESGILPLSYHAPHVAKQDLIMSITLYAVNFQSVTLHTDVGDLKMELFCDRCPKTCEVRLIRNAGSPL